MIILREIVHSPKVVIIEKILCVAAIRLKFRDLKSARKNDVAQIALLRDR